MVDIRPRSAWNARSPKSVTSRSLSYWRGVRVHHSAGPYHQSIREIQNFHMDSNGWSDIGYNFVVKDGQIWTGRGWNRHPAHDGVNDTLGVCVVGTYTNSLPSPRDLDALVEFIREARRRTGKDLPVSGHRDAAGANTACPGNRLYGHLPTIRQRVEGDDDVSAKEVWTYRVPLPDWVADRWEISADDWAALVYLRSGYGHSRATNDNTKELIAGQAAILAKVGGADLDEIQARIRTELGAAADRERAERKDEQGELEVLLQDAAAERAALAELVAQHQRGELDAVAVVDELARRLGAQ